jgi:hypothetical protein
MLAATVAPQLSEAAHTAIALPALLSWHAVSHSRTEVLWLETTLGTHVVEIVDGRYDVLAGPALTDSLIAHVNAERVLLAAWERDEQVAPLYHSPRIVLDRGEIDASGSLFDGDLRCTAGAA